MIFNADIRTSFPIKDYVFFVVSNEPWGKQWFLKHHYAAELARLGYAVYFLDPVGAWSPSGLFSTGLERQATDSSVDVISYQNPLPLRFLPDLALRGNDWLNAKKLEKLADGRKSIVWQFDAFRFAYNFLPNSRKIYHVADHYRDLHFDTQNAENADLIVCTSETFMPYYSGFGKKILYVPHAVSSTESDVDGEHARLLRQKFGDFLLHAGSVNDRIDLDIFLALTEEFGEHNLVLIGPDKITRPENRAKWGRLLERGNFHFEGTVPASQVRDYAAASKTCLLAYQFDEMQTLGPITSSLKVLNYLAQTRPIVSSSRIEYDSLIDRGIFYAEDLSAFIDLARRALAGEIEVDKDVARQFLTEHSYVKFIGDILSTLDF
ncbi:MAG: hypothetical protein R2684_15710 [Pyrinomonadaceae bacterium]